MSGESKQQKECEICWNSFNKSTRYEVTCPSCSLHACRECVKRYLLSSSELPHCMNPDCKSAWDRAFIIDACTYTFVNKKYKEHRTDLLLDQEKARFPETMPAVENYLKSKDLRETISKEEAELREMRQKMRNLQRKLNWNRRALSMAENGESISEEKKKEFKQKCGVDGCNGFLSSQWKCGICKNWSCPKCFEVLGEVKECGHECNPDSVASANLIKKETRNCPSCATPIYKIHGCFEKGTPVLMWDGSIKSIEDINIKDEIVGTDGLKRVVQDTFQGFDNMYTVQQNSGITYTVNSKHELLLKPAFYKNMTIKSDFIKIEWYCKNTNSFKSKKMYYDSNNFNIILKNAEYLLKDIDNKPIRICVDEYVKLKKSIKARLYGFKNYNISWQNSDNIILDPYILGSWLGDGYSDGSGISGNDKEVIHKWISWADENDAEIIHSNPYRFSVRRKGSGYKRGAVGSEADCPACKKVKSDICDEKREYQKVKKKLNATNPLKEQLSKYKLLHNKHIPFEYLTSTKDIRLQLLAGLIDTDGCVSNYGKRVVIIQVNKKLSDQICILARSLGLVVSVSIRKRNNISVPNCALRKNYNDQYHINISGTNLSEIPTKIKRKKCINNRPNKDYFKTGIEVSFKEHGKYYGIRVDQNNEFILADFTSVKNCDQMWCTQCHVAFSWKTGMRVNGVIHNPHFYQWQNSGGGAPPVHTPGAQMCGGLPNAWQFRRRLNRLLNGSSHTSCVWSRNVIELLQNVNHFQHYELDRLRRDCQGARDNVKLRIQFLCKEINEKTMRSKISSKDKMYEKKQALLQIYELCMHIFTENINDILQLCIELENKLTNGEETKENAQINLRQTIVKNLDTCHKLRIYANNEIIKISRTYKQVVGFVNKHFRIIKLKIGNKDKLPEQYLILPQAIA